MWSIGMAGVLCTAALASPTARSYTLLSDPPLAQVYDKLGNWLCETPCELMLAAFAFKSPRLIFDRHLGVAESYVVAREGYEQQVLVITEGPFKWTSLDGTQQFEYYQILSTQATARLVPLRSDVGSDRGSIVHEAVTTRPCADGFGRAADGNCYAISIPQSENGSDGPLHAPVLIATPMPSPSAAGLATVPVEVIHVLLSHNIGVKRCFVPLLNLGRLPSRVDVSFTLSSNGNAFNLGVIQPEFVGSKLERCLGVAVAAIAFPPTSGSGQNIVYPFVLK